MEWSMPRFHNIEGKLVQFTNAEEAARDAEEKAHSDAAPARAWEAIRIKRNAKLAESDWMSYSDSPTMSSAWKTYRQALRDLPASESDPDDITWPTEPS